MGIFEMVIVAVAAFGFILIALEKVGWLDSIRTFVLRDPLAVLGVGSAAFAFLLWAWLGCLPSSSGGCLRVEWFSPERLPAVAVFSALALILLLLRRR